MTAIIYLLERTDRNMDVLSKVVHSICLIYEAVFFDLEKPYKANTGELFREVCRLSDMRLASHRNMTEQAGEYQPK